MRPFGANPLEGATQVRPEEIISRTPLLAYRATPPRFVTVATAFASRVEPQVRDAISADSAARSARELVSAEEHRREQMPFGINEDLTYDVYRAPQPKVK